MVHDCYLKLVFNYLALVFQKKVLMSENLSLI